MQYRDRLPPWSAQREWPVYEPKVFGFRINAESSMVPKMAWLRRMPNGYR